MIFMIVDSGDDLVDKETYKKIIGIFKRERNAKKCCFYCGQTNPAAFELHHPLGRNNSDLITDSCKNCHAIITAEQDKVSPKARSAKASPQQKRAYADVSMGASLELLGKKLKERGFERCNSE